MVFYFNKIQLLLKKKDERERREKRAGGNACADYLESAKRPHNYLNINESFKKYKSLSGL